MLENTAHDLKIKLSIQAKQNNVDLIQYEVKDKDFYLPLVVYTPFHMSSL